MPQPTRVALGKIGRPHGVRGEVRLFLFNPESETLIKGMRIFLAPDGLPPTEAVIEKIRYTPKFVILKFKGINGREAIDQFKHAHLEVEYDDLPDLDEDEFYHLDLIGFPVYLAAEENGELPEDTEPIGEVDRFFETGGANDVIVIRRNEDSELFVPVVEHAISFIDFDRELVVLQPLEIWTPREKNE